MDLERKTVGVGARPALVLVDMCNGFTDPQSPLGGCFDDVVATNAALLAIFRAAQLPVCFTTVVYDQPDQARIFRQRIAALNVMAAGSPWVDIDRRLAPADGEPVFAKHWASAFFATPLADWLREQGADSLVVTGLTTSGCVRATVVDGLQHDYPVLVPEEAVADRNADAHAANLHDMHAKYAEVLPLHELLMQLPR